MSESPKRGWRRPETSLVLVLLGLLLVGGLISRLAGTSTDSPQANTSPTATTRVPIPAITPREFASRSGNNRAAAAAGATLAKTLYTDHQSYWEVYVRTTPITLAPVDPTNPDSAVKSAAPVTDVKVVIATESGATLNHFRAGGHAHEQAVMAAAADQLHARFPHATISFDIYFGESHLHATATYAAGVFKYKVVDTL
jgi:hypothetical protein